MLVEMEEVGSIKICLGGKGNGVDSLGMEMRGKEESRKLLDFSFEPRVNGVSIYMPGQSRNEAGSLW